MIISFDLDDTLIPSSKRFPLESRPLISRIFKHESLRLGSVQLFKNILEAGHVTYIYTTSFRSKSYIKLLFLFYGIRIKKVLNQRDNLNKQKSQTKQYSKNPSLFQIDLHVDDLPGVLIESKNNNSNVLIIEDSKELDIDYLMRRIQDFVR